MRKFGSSFDREAAVPDAVLRTASVQTSVLAGSPGVHPEILATMGEEFAHNLTAAMELILHAVAKPRNYIADLTRAHFLMDGLRRKSMAMQQISRLAQNRVRQSHEKLALHQVTQTVVDEHRAQYAASGMVVTAHLKPVEIIVDPGLLVNLIAVALEWVTEFGTVVRMSSSMKNWPQHGLLSLVAEQGVRTQDDIDQKTVVNQSIAWHLLEQTAHAMGVGLQMDETVNARSLVIEFPRTVVALEGMTMVEMEAGPGSDSFGSVHSNFVAGHHIMVISADFEFFKQVREICKSLSVRCEQAPSVEMAERLCEHEVPNLVLCEESMADEHYDLLLNDLQRHTPGFPTILVCDGDHGFEFADWSDSSCSRISRKQIADQLPSALTIELSRTI